MTFYFVVIVAKKKKKLKFFSKFETKGGGIFMSLFSHKK